MNMLRSTPWFKLILTGIAGSGVLLTAGCTNIEKAPRRPSASSIGTPLDVPQIMRGTVASEAIVIGHQSSSSPTYRPVVVQGYGLVVGLHGTGSRDLSPDLRATMLSEMSRGGIGSARTGYGELSPAGMLDSLDTAVVIVQGIIPLGATEATPFDVRVFPVPSTSTTSLEGGLLYTTQLHTDLSLGRTEARSFALAQARGSIFVNPFAEPGAIGRDSIDRRNGRILNGGSVMQDMPLKLRLVNPNHARAGMLVTAINTRFPLERGQSNPTARGESDDSIVITIPPSFDHRVDEFVELMKHSTIRQANPESVAMSIRRILETNPTPGVALAAAWRWQALGIRVLPIIREFYTSPQERLRSAAIGAGAKLDDPIVVPHLADLAQTATTPIRLQAIRLMERMGLNPLIDQTLRSMLNDRDATVRIEAYETLARRGDPSITHTKVDEKFLVDVVPSDIPMIYVTEIGLPRIALFGRNLAIAQPLFLQTWSNRLMLSSDPEQDFLEVYYRPMGLDQGYVSRVDPEMEEFVRFLGHTSTVDAPAPGLGLTYGETVGALYRICNEKYIICSKTAVAADFKAQQDRIQAAILAQQQEATTLERPEFEQPPVEDQSADESFSVPPPPAPDMTRPVSSSGAGLP